MVADFRAQNVDTDKVSKAVKQFVASVAKTENSKKKIDSDKECFFLGEYLSGNAHLMNKDEVGYVQGLMVEYQNSKRNEYITDSTKKESRKAIKCKTVNIENCKKNG